MSDDKPAIVKPPEPRPLTPLQVAARVSRMERDFGQALLAALQLVLHQAGTTDVLEWHLHLAMSYASRTTSQRAAELLEVEKLLGPKPAPPQN